MTVNSEMTVGTQKVGASTATAEKQFEKVGPFKVTPLNLRRWQNFKANRRGYWSLWIFLFLFIFSLFAEFIANDRPILVFYKGEILAPVFVDYPEEKFGGFLPVTDYRDPVNIEEIEANGWMLWPPIRYSYSTTNVDVPRPAPSPPTWLLETEACRARSRPGPRSWCPRSARSSGCTSASTRRRSRSSTGRPGRRRSTKPR